MEVDEVDDDDGSAGPRPRAEWCPVWDAWKQHFASHSDCGDGSAFCFEEDESLPPIEIMCNLTHMHGPAGTYASALVFKPVIKQVATHLSRICARSEPRVLLSITSALLLLSEIHPIVKPIARKHCSSYTIDFASFASSGAASQSVGSAWEDEVQVAKTGYRAARLMESQLEYPWRWSSYLDLLNSSAKRAKWFAINAMSLLLRLAQHTRLALLSKHFSRSERLQFYLDWRFEQRKIAKLRSQVLYSDRLSADNLDKISRTICVPTMDSFASSLTTEDGPSYIRTPSSTDTYDCIMASLQQNRHIMLWGASGCGKSALVKTLHNHRRRNDMLVVHMHKSMDSRVLIGTYVCTSKAGEFQWNQGPLTIAALQGKWLCIEEINSAPQEALALLASVAESSEIHVPGRGTHRVKSGFLMLGLCTQEDSGSESLAYCSLHLRRRLWAHHYLRAHSVEDSVDIAMRLYPSLQCLCKNVLAMYSFLSRITLKGWQHDDNLRGILQSADLNPTEVMSNLRCQYNLRHLLQLCERLVSCHREWLTTSSEVASETLRKMAFYHSLDIFCGGVRDEEFGMRYSKAFLQFWGLSSYHMDEYKSYKPIMDVRKSYVSIGRATIPRSLSGESKMQESASIPFVATAHSLRLLEKTAIAIQTEEAILLVGETGIGKTACIQHLSKITGTELLVLNMNQQSDSSDLVGSFRPVESHVLLMPMLVSFQSLVRITWPPGNNAEFFRRLHSYVHKKKWLKLINGFKIGLQKLVKSPSLVGAETSNHLSAYLEGDSLNGSKPKKAKVECGFSLAKDIQKRWTTFADELFKIESQILAEATSSSGGKAHFSFSFVEGILVRAMKEGKWLLVDEINLAPSEALEKLFAVLDSKKGTFSLTERGDTEALERHANFRLFAAMNPGTDAGKKELPPNLRSRFTEFYVAESLSREDLEHIVRSSFEKMSIESAPTSVLIDFYIYAKQQSRENLYDCSGQKPHYSLRTLCRTLEYALKAIPAYGMNKAIQDGIYMSFFTQLDKESRSMLGHFLRSKLSEENADEYHERRAPVNPDLFVEFESFFLRKGPLDVKTTQDPEFAKYIITKSVKQRLRDLSRAIYFHKSPILLQGPTSAGKTSLVKHIASASGYKCIRINNHANTDVQEYTGTYSTDQNGNIRFHEGPLVQALRMGYWVILDELNLAPSDVLEALNRLLDDNRELYVPEINECVKPHPNFMLFATQNPAGAYGGRKTLSRAFRNRFIEIYVDDIPEAELPIILEKSCLIAESQAKRMVQSSKKLRQYRQKSAVFAGKHGYITPRDLLKWGNRSQRSTLQEMSENGYSLLAERLRDFGEKEIVEEILQKEFRSVLKTSDLYDGYVAHLMQGVNETKASHGKLSMGKSMQRLLSLIHKCWKNGEPVLLVGETGCGKTTACQVLAELGKKTLHIYNCHQHSETSDFIGSYRPARSTQVASEKFWLAARELMKVQALRNLCKDTVAVDATSSTDCSLFDASKVLSCIEDAMDRLRDADAKLHETSLPKLVTMRECNIEMKVPFEWVDGPLVTAMKHGDFILVDELSLAEDAVLERLNSVLEVGGSITLSEKGSDVVEEIKPREGFFLLATMNPGGDFGKRELSPALRNRFTEIWVPPIEDLSEIKSIITERLAGGELAERVVDKMLQVWKLFLDNALESLEGQKKLFLSIRDLVAWADFVKLKASELGSNLAFGHGAHLVFLDGFGVGTGNDSQMNYLKSSCQDFVAKLSQVENEAELMSPSTKVIFEDDVNWGIQPFFVRKGSTAQSLASNYNMTCPTAVKNLWRILRAMQMQRALLLEGSPGVGKSSMIQNLAQLTSNQVVRINLSEHTDMMDLLGAESPCDPTANGGALFKWQDGPLLTAIKSGSWVLLDELNLAQQSVLEGLNALLDHRADIFIPELNQTFSCPPTFKVFATQNPMQEGGGRKGLPKSFLNRFTKVYMESLTVDDFREILQTSYPDLPQELLCAILSFNDKVKKAVAERQIGHSGGPWDFNFRDVTRCIEIIYAIFRNSGDLSVVPPVLALAKKYTESECKMSFKNLEEVASKAIESVYVQRTRSVEDREYLAHLFCSEFGVDQFEWASIPETRVTSAEVSVGHARMICNNNAGKHSFKWESLDTLEGCHRILESVVQSVSNGWMCSFVGDWKGEGLSMPSIIAGITGHDLKAIKLTNCTDTSDLLGSFEQHSMEGDVLTAMKKAEELVLRLSTILIESDAMNLSESSTLMLDLHKEALHLKKFGLANDGIKGNNLLGHLHTVSMKVMETEAVVGSHCSEEKDVMSIFEQLKNSLCQISNGRSFSGFSWVDGPLVEAIKEGKWILLEDANLCNPAVLDRLNPLLEGSNSYFMLNESTGSMERLTPHKDFRLFLAWNPASGGEISRAMRNRGLEFYSLKQTAHIQVMDRISDRCLTAGAPMLSSTVSRVLIFLAESDVDVLELSEKVGSHVLDLVSRNSQVPADAASRESLHTRLANYFSILKYTSFGKGNQIQHMEFALKYARALDHSEELKADNTVNVPADTFISVLRSYYGRLNLRPGDLLEPDFLMLDADSACLINLLAQSNSTQEEIRRAFEHFLYSARTFDDMVLRKSYALISFQHAAISGMNASIDLQPLRSFIEQEVPNPMFSRFFDKQGEICKGLNAEEGFKISSPSSKNAIHVSMKETDWILEKCFLSDEVSMLKTLSGAAQNQSEKGSLSVLSYSIRKHQMEDLQYFHEDWNQYPALNQVAPLLTSFLDFEEYVLKSLDRDWTADFRVTFLEYQKHRSFLYHWMETEKIGRIRNFDYFVYILVGLSACIENLARAEVTTVMGYKTAVEALKTSMSVVMGNLGLGQTDEYEVPQVYRAGRALIIADSRVLELTKGLHAISSQLTLCHGNGNIALDLDDAEVACFRKDIQEGLALISLASKDGSMDKIDSAHQMCHILEKKYKKLADKCTGADLHQVGEEFEDSDELVHKILLEDADYTDCMKRKGNRKNLLPLFSWKPFLQLVENLQILANFHNLMSEFYILPSLIGFCNTDAHSEESLLHSREVLQRISSFASKNNCRSALDFVVHQQLLWLLEGGKIADHALLVSQVHEFSYNWFESLMKTCGAFNSLANNAEDMNNHSTMAENLHSGLYHSHSMVAYKLVSCNVPCILQRFYVKSLDTAERILHQEYQHGLRSKDVEQVHLTEMLRQVSLCYEDSSDLMKTEIPDHLLSIKSQDDIEEIDSCLRAMLHLSFGSENSRLSTASTKIIEMILQSVRRECTSSSNHQRTMKRGLLWLGLGLLRVHLALPPNGYDPALKPAHEAYGVEVKLKQTELITGIVDQTQLSQLGESFPTRGIQNMLLDTQRKSTLKAAKLRRSVPIRQDDVSYQDLVRDVSTFLEQKLNVEKIDGILRSFETDSLSMDALNSVGETSSMWAESMKSKYSSYSDILQPLNLGVLQLAYGVSTINFAFERRMDLCNEFFHDLVSLPRGDSANWVDSANVFFNRTDFELDDKHLQTIKIVKCCLLASADRLQTSKFSTMLWKFSNVLLGQYTHIWNVAKRKEDRELEEVSALYKSARNESKDEMREFQRIVMNDDGDYEEVCIEGDIRDNIKNTMEREFAYDIMMSHWKATQAFKEEMNHVQDSGDLHFLQNRCASRVEEFVDCYDTMSKFMDSKKSYLKCSSQGSVNAHLLRIHLRKRALSESQSVLAMRSQVQLFYARLDKIREDWPDNELLAQLKDISGRLLLLPSDAPIKKAMSGLELLLLRSLTWEESAASHVSLKREIDALALVANMWRKEELQSMGNLFRRNEVKHRKMASVGWLHLFEILKHFTSTKACMLNLEDILQSVEEFIQTSSVGQFETRLEIVKIFYRHLQVYDLMHVPALKRHQVLQHLTGMLQNLHSYYSQFLPAVRDEISRGTDVLTKELDDFIQLSKWEDVNVYAMRNNIEKSNRTLHKLRLRHDELLRQGMNEIWAAQSKKMGFGGLGSENLPEEGTSREELFESILNSFKNQCKDALATNSSENSDDDSHFFGKASFELKDAFKACDKKMYRYKLPKLVVRAKKLCQPIFGDAPLSGVWMKIAMSIDTSAFEVAHRAAQLKGLEKPAKMQKQKALSDLLKSLKNLGYSKTKKSVSLQRVFLKYFKTPSSSSIPVICSSLLDESVANRAYTMFSKSETYFYKSLATYQELSDLSAEYHSDIQGSEFECMVAYIRSQLDTCFQLRVLLESSALRNGTLSNLMDTLKALRYSMAEGLPKGASFKPSRAKKVREWLWKIDSVCEHARSVLVDAQMLIDHSCYDLDDVIPEVAALIETANNCKSEMDSLLTPGFGKVRAMSELIQLHRGHTKKGERDWRNLWPIMPESDAVPRAELVMGKLWEVHRQLVVIDGKLNSRGFSSLSRVCGSLESDLTSVSSMENSTLGGVKVENEAQRSFLSSFGSAFTKAIEDVLIWIERLSLHRTQNEAEVLEIMDVTRFDFESLQLDFATRKLEALKSQMDSKFVRQTEENLALLFRLLGAHDLKCEDDLGLILHDLSKLHDLCAVAFATHRYLCVQLLMLLRASAKLTHVTSSVFIGLCREGYCVPPGFDERQHDENGAFQETDGVGMGEGEGVKDVSDKIENEEQVEGLKGDDDPEKEQEGSRPEEDTKGVEMAEDFDGNLFDIQDDDSDDDKDGEEEDGEQEKLEQQMGDKDETFDAADERLWNEEDEEAENKDGEEGGAPAGDGTEEMMNIAEDDQERETNEAKEGGQGEEDQANDSPNSDSEDAVNEMDTDIDHGIHLEREAKEEENQGSDEEGGAEADTDKGEVDGSEGQNSEDETAAEHAEEDLQDSPEQENTEEVSGEMAEDEKLQMDAPQDNNPENEDDVMSDGEGERKEEVAGLEAEDSEDNVPNDLMDAEYPQSEELDGDLDANEGPDGQPNRQDLPQDNVSMGAGVNLGVENEDRDEDPAHKDPSDAKETQRAASAHPGAHDVKEQSEMEVSTKEKDEDRGENQQRQGINPHRKFGEAIERWKLEASVNMDLDGRQEEGGGPNDDEALQEEYAFDTGEGDREGGPEALGLAHEVREEAEQVEADGERKEDRDGAQSGEDVRVTERSTGEEEKPLNVEESKPKHPQESRETVSNRDRDAGRGPPEDDDARGDEEMVDLEEEEGDGHGQEYRARAHLSSAELDGAARDDTAEDAGPHSANAVSDGQGAPAIVFETAEGRAKWNKSSASVSSLVGELTEQLRLVLVPTQISKMAGDFRTGKRLNIRKLIPYIASNFKKDKIWLRRTQPDKREYQVLLAVDDSRSMVENKCEKFALDSVALLCNAMSRLEVGDLGILSFGGAQGVADLHSLGKPFDASSGASICSALNFAQESTVHQHPVLSVLREGLGIFHKWRREKAPFGRPLGLHQLLLVVADGRINEEAAKMRALVHDAISEGGLMVVFIALDTKKNSLLDVQAVEFVDNRPVLKKYMDSFPFPYYLLVRDIRTLPRTLADLVRQWVEMVGNSD